MSIYKRGGVYWYKFQWKGELVRESTKQGNDKLARQMEAAHKTPLRKAKWGYATRSQLSLLENSAEALCAVGQNPASARKTWRDFYQSWADGD